MNKRCKHIEEDGFHRCGSYAFNLHKDDIDQGDLCDVHYWQAKAQRTWVGIPEKYLKQGDESFFVAWREGARWAEATLKRENGYAEEKNG